MNPGAKEYRERSCGKVQYQSKKEAQTVVNHQAKSHNGTRLRSYQCLICNKYHLATVKDGDNRKK